MCIKNACCFPVIVQPLGAKLKFVSPIIQTLLRSILPSPSQC